MIELFGLAVEHLGQRLTVVPVAPRPGVGLVIVEHDHTALADWQNLVLTEREGGRVPQRSDGAATVSCPVRLRAVLDHY